MRILLRVVLAFIALVILSCVAAFIWFRFYTRDLPDSKALALYAPSTEVEVVDSCTKTTSVAIPYEAIGSNLRAALNAAEGSGVRGTTPLDIQISRSMFCMPSQPLRRALDELRVALELKRQFSSQQLLTIYANRAHFGQNIVGVQAAAQDFYHKNSGDLSVAEAALIAGLIKAPSFYSPSTHPDRALKRRNDVIAAMLANGTIGSDAAAKAKRSDLEIQH